MRIVITAATFLAMALASAAPAQAERRMFIVANNPDSYGVDRCLNTGAPCGAAVANSYCHSHEFAQALSYEKVDRDDITGGGPEACRDPNCSYVAITCSR